LISINPRGLARDYSVTVDEHHKGQWLRSVVMENLGYETGQPSAAARGVVARLFGELRQIFSDISQRASLRDEFADLDRRGGLDTVLDDIGLTRAELAKIIAGYPVSGRMLPVMAQRLGVDIEALDPRTRYQLARGCALCQSRRTCRRWLAAKPADSTTYREFCPNAEMLDAVNAAPR
jgi:Family of unknown function (DUF6455)